VGEDTRKPGVGTSLDLQARPPKGSKDPGGAVSIAEGSDRSGGDHIVF